MTISDEVLDVLSNAKTSGHGLVLPEQLARPLYVATNKVLELAGGKWNRKAKAHLFEGDAAEIMDQVILTGKITDKKQELGYFPTPKKVVDRLLDLAEIDLGMTVLEPSAGQGAIVRELLGVTPFVYAIERDRGNYEALAKIAGEHRVVIHEDFLGHRPDMTRPVFDRVVMNPPFRFQTDIKHVLHAFKFLKPGGRLVSVMSASVTFRTNKLTTEFRQFVADHNGTFEKLPEGSFSESGTDINTVIVTLEA
jgi:predicted RNA methylase